MARAYGSGSVTPHRGKWLARLPARLGREALGIFDIRSDAENALDAALLAVATGAARPGSGKTIMGAAEEAMDAREKAGYANADDDRRTLKRHVFGQDWALLHIASFTEEMGQAWLDSLCSQEMSKSRIANTLNAFRAVFRYAMHKRRKWIGANPLERVEIDEETYALARAGEWDYLRANEIAALMAAVPADASAKKKHGRPRVYSAQWAMERWIVACAIALGLRQGEQWNLELVDVHLDDIDPHVFIRFGSHGGTPKNDKPRRVWLTSFATQALRAWLKVLPIYAPKNPHALVFPGPTGARRQKGKLPPSWKPALAAAGITRSIRWHDLRHTCASMLLSGHWGRRWTLAEVSAHLGHSSIQVTERYAHLAEDAQKYAAKTTTARLTAGAAWAGSNLETNRDLPTASAEKLSHLGDLNPRPTVYEFGANGRVHAHLEGLRFQFRTRSDAARRAIAERSPHAIALLLDADDAARDLEAALGSEVARAV
jgi:integrase